MEKRIEQRTIDLLPLLLAAAVGIAGCQSSGPKTDAPASAPTAAAPAPAPASSSSKAAAAPAPSAPKIGPGMNANGEVINSKIVEAGYGRKVKGHGDWEGEITGKPAPGSNFTKLEIGMPVRQVTDLVGQPTDSGAYVTGKAFIPFYFGSDRHRFEMVYKGKGRLIFAGGGMGDYSSGNLIWIIHSASESGYR